MTDPITVTTQAELDAAIAAGARVIDIRSEPGSYITVRACDSTTVTACGSTTVRAYGSTTVMACDSATVMACDSTTVTAYDSATVTACDSTTVTAYDSATVAAYGSATVRAHDSATVTARPRVAVHCHSRRASIVGGVIIDHTQEPTDPDAWCAYHGIEVADGVATVYKAVGDNWISPHGTSYAPGTLPEAADWRDDNDCGGGLHFSPSPAEATAYHREATRWLAVGVSVADLRPILGDTPKCKAPRVATPCRPVTIDGDPIEVQS
ncbi:DUF7666 domain-containing protein [Collinsella bouchesdurhonensis]|uniref:DUF7666 domain-containing protein n=1 Tax=Collinsella bouchesdurhonensis TaxID=1907654 RepID=UPI003F8DC194